MDFLTRIFGGAPLPQQDPRQVKERLEGRNKPLIVDVRQADEYRQGHIPGSRLIPLGELNRRMHELPMNREILCVCRSGSRSSRAVRQLLTGGYQVANLRGGMLAWQREGFPVKKGSA